MSVGILLITHVRLGKDLLSTVQEMMDDIPLRTSVLEVRRVQDTDVLLRQGSRLIDTLDSGDGVLILTDAYGSTPSNIANGVADPDRCCVVSGINLPMLISVYNFPKLKLKDLAKCAVKNGRDGIILCDKDGNL